MGPFQTCNSTLFTPPLLVPAEELEHPGVPVPGPPPRPVELHLLVLELPGELAAHAGQPPRHPAPVLTHAPGPDSGVKTWSLNNITIL